MCDVGCCCPGRWARLAHHDVTHGSAVQLVRACSGYHVCPKPLTINPLGQHDTPPGGLPACQLTSWNTCCLKGLAVQTCEMKTGPNVTFVILAQAHAVGL